MFSASSTNAATSKSELHPLTAELGMRRSPADVLQWRDWSADPQLRKDVEAVMANLSLKGTHVGKTDLKKRIALVLGLGAIGGIAFQQLARSGVGTVLGVDPDSYGGESFLTQPIDWRDKTQPKALVQGRRAYAANPAVRVRTAVGYAQELPLRVLRLADILLVAGDHLELPVWTCRMAAALGKPVVQGAVHGETGTAIVRGFDLRDCDASCLQCGLGRRALNEQRSRYGCDPSTLRSQGIEPTRTIPTICALAGELAASEALKWLAGNEQVALRGEECAYSLSSHRAWRSALPRSAACELPHRRWRLVDLDRPLCAIAPAILAERLGIRGGPGLLQVRSEIPWISFVICAECGSIHLVRRFARLGREVGRCPKCSTPLVAGPQGLRSVIPHEDLEACWEKCFCDLGLELGEAVGLLIDDEWTYFFSPDEAANGEWVRSEPAG